MSIQRRVVVVLMIILASTVTVGNEAEVRAQEGPVTWSAPLNLTNTPTRSHHQFVAADSYGYVHVFWSEDFGGPEIPMGPPVDRNQPDSTQPRPDEREEEGNPGNTIFYRRWDGTTWSEPVDLFFTNSNTFTYPTAVVDEDGTIYLVWMSPSGVYFSSAPSREAMSAQAWTSKKIIAPATGFRPALLAQGTEGVSVVYSAFRQVEEGKDGNLYFINSVDGGQGWSKPVQISFVNRGTETLSVFPRLVEDGKGRLHLVWYETDPPSYVGTAVYYAQSADEGATWSLPLKVDEVTPENNWAATINIAAAGEEEIHLVWVCGEKSHRCHQWSTDGGVTWTPVRRLFGELHSRANWDAMATDANGNVYWIMQLRYPYAMYYTYWDGNRWLDPPILFNSDPYVAVGHGVQLTISHGNELHALVHHPSVFEIWHLQGISAVAPEQRPQPMPTMPPTSTPTVRPSATPIVVSTATRENRSLREISEEETMIDNQGPATGLVIGIIPAVLIVGSVALFKLFARRN